LAFALFISWRVINSRTFQFFGRLVSSVPCTEKYVALTLDDGPTAAETNALLELFGRHAIHATFFLIGRDLDQLPEAGRQIVLAGHELGNHSYSHTRMLFASQAFIRDEVERTDAAVHRAGQSGKAPFRPPYGKKLFGLPWYLQQTGRTTVMWDIEPESTPGVEQTPEGIARHVVDNARPGSIILLHAMRDPTGFKLRALESMLEGLDARGYRVVSFAELEDRCASTRG
jgi:peptidoglycan/xylan/chitin deacetylase (PgdA/CDA1 family)